MDTIFMNSKNSDTSDPHRVLLNVTDEVKLKWIIFCIRYPRLFQIYLKKKQKETFDDNPSIKM